MSGNTRDGQLLSYNWTLPYIIGKRVEYLGVGGSTYQEQATEHRCVLRLRLAAGAHVL